MNSKTTLKEKNANNYLTHTKNTKGITLIALVVTIVVLLILAGVTINAVFSDNGIINRVKDAQNKMDEAGQKDLNSINELNNLIENHTGGDNSNSTGTWTQNKTTVTNGTTTYTVGDSYEYDCGVEGYLGGWKVLGAENSKLLIMSTLDVGTLSLSGVDGYTNGIKELTDICEPYGTDARSITLRDINRVTGYVPKHETISITSENEYYYDNDIANKSPTVTGTYAAYAGEYGLATALGITNNNPVTGNTYCYYYPNTLTSSSSGDTVGITTDSAAYEMIFGKYTDSSASKGNEYWLASSCVSASSYGAYFGMFHVGSDGHVGPVDLWDSEISDNNYSFGIRAVVPL